MDSMDMIVAEDNNRSEELEAAIFTASKTLRGLDIPVDFVTPAASVELVRVANKCLNSLQGGDIPEAIDNDFRLVPDVLGQILMNEFGLPEQPMNKARLLEIAQWMGPDYLEALRRAVAFMVKVESF